MSTHTDSAAPPVNTAPNEGAPPAPIVDAAPAAPVNVIIEGAPGAPAVAAPAKQYNAKASNDTIDFMRVRRDSAVGRVNALLSFDVAKTVKELSIAADCATTAAHLSWAFKRSFVLRTAPSTYLRAPHTREGAAAPVVDAMAALTTEAAKQNEVQRLLREAAEAVAPPAEAPPAEAPPAEAPPAEAPPAPVESSKERKARLRAERAAAKAAGAPTVNEAPVENVA